jgi:hypothetical protein
MAKFGLSCDDKVEPAPPINSAYHLLDERGEEPCYNNQHMDGKPEYNNENNNQEMVTNIAVDASTPIFQYWETHKWHQTMGEGKIFGH